ncbi:MAG: prolyl oligopeptidase family serine peptidase [Planctomycetes bacterium]|nr:prolyl oligopeptidase family serine peptidase [Planctomycetota bacterium]
MRHRQSLLFAAALAAVLAASTPGQEAAEPVVLPALQLADYDGWRTLQDLAVRDDGAFVAFSLVPQRGDAELVVRAVGGDVEYRQPCGRGAAFSADGRYVLLRIEPTFEATRSYEIDKLVRAERAKEAREKGETPPKQEEPKKPESRRALLDLQDGAVTVLENVKAAQLCGEGLPYLLLHLEPPKPATAKPATGSAQTEPAGQPAPPESRPEPAASKPVAAKPPAWHKDGSPLVIRDLRDGSEVRIEGVVAFGSWDEAGYVWYARNSKADDPAITRGLFARKLETGAETMLIDGAGDFRGFATDDEHTRVAFYSNRDDREAKTPRFDVFVWRFGDPEPRRVLSRGHPQMPAGEHVAEGHRLSFSRDGSTLLVAVEPQEREPLPPILDDEKVAVDLWHWRDPVLQPMQEKQRGRLSSQRRTCALDLADGRLVPLVADPQESVRFLTPDGSLALVTDSARWAIETSWDGRYEDVYVVNTVDGARTRLWEHVRDGVSPSPDGRYLLRFDGSQWHCTDVATGRTATLTAGIDADFSRETDDRPEPRNADGVEGWTAGEREVVLSDGRDLWAVTPDGSRARCVTDRVGAAENIEFRYRRLDPDARFVPEGEPILLQATDLDTMDQGFYTDRVDGLGRPVRLVTRACAFGGLSKAKDADRVFFTMSRFEQFPDLWTAGLDFAEPVRLSDANPQQSRFRWGTAELVEWRSLDGVPLKGILVKPDGFDPARRYPLMVYFYEKLSRTLHSYGTPRLNTSPQAIQYVSDGYLWFQPDINYVDGHPGDSALHCIVPGIQALVARGFVDERAIGAAGHSWGGYQTAYLVTRTDLFAAVESGAPVSNMTSAYGGIRWGSGASRAFQYEQTQSRIGGTLWDRPLQFLENSPIFHVDRVHTPILMLHNDRDGAVPWYQGIEYFCALRRLGKEAYLLNYNGQDHGLSRRADLLDWTVRMKQFFDHHLRGAPAPAWMVDGVRFDERELRARELYEPESLRIRRELESQAGVAAPAEPEAGAATSGG